MNELQAERIVTYRACFEEGIIPLMFETEPIEDVKFSIDNMLQSADCFLGIYFHTVGSPQYSLEEMTPIEYELAKFIRLQCHKCNNQQQDGICKNETLCLNRLRRIFTAHYPIQLCKSRNFDIQSLTQTDSISACLKIIRSLKRNKLIYLFSKYPYNENDLSTELFTLLNGLKEIGFEHDDFRTQWELVSKIHKEFKSTDNTRFLKKRKKAIWISYDGENSIGQTAQLAKVALVLNLNLEFMYSKVNNNKAHIIAKYREWGSKRETANAEIVRKSLKQNFDELKEINNKLKNLSTFYKKIFDEHCININKFFTINNIKPIDYAFSYFNSIRLDTFELNKLKTEDSTKTINDEKKIRKIVEETLNDDLNEYDLKNHIRVKIILLNVPGVLFRITNLIAGNKPDRFSFKLNIKTMFLYEYRENILFRIGIRKECRTRALTKNTIKEKTNVVPWNLRGKFLQSVEMILELQSDDYKFEKDSLAEDLNFVCGFHSALSSVVGVESIHIAPVIPTFIE